jgi:polar amino acid transport system permease protein
MNYSTQTAPLRDTSVPIRPLGIKRHLAGALAFVALSLLFAAVCAATLTIRVSNPSVLYFVFIGITLLALIPPLWSCVSNSRKSAFAWQLGKSVESREHASLARNAALTAIGYSGFLLVIFGVLIFAFAQNGAVYETFLQKELIETSFKYIAKAFLINIGIAIVSQILSMLGGLLLAMARLLPGRGLAPIRFLAISYIDLFRGLPAIVTIYLVCFGLPLTGIPVISQASPVFYAIVALTLTFSAYNAEIFRSGIQSIHASQTSAAVSLGLTGFSTFRLVVLPQAVRNICPVLLSYFIALQKDTALVNVVGIVDAFSQAKIYSSNYFNLSSVTVVCILFIAITIPQTRLVDYLIKSNAKRRGR